MRGSDLVTVAGMALVNVFLVSAISASGLAGWLIAGVVVSALASYVALARLLNSTIARVTPDSIVLQHRPLPWPGSRVIGAGEISDIGSKVQPIKWDFGGLSRHSVFARCGRGNVTLYELSDVDGEAAAAIASDIRDRLGL